ncbi:MAG: type 4a pilus biogenesis protein PilO [Phycisphaerae bacterium]|nr:type 4a pilus biogenesis protein PilO [Phycisphaerae bacterium]MDW8260923.1 type 4a pilus biogenesis protein PilO [Phycisphaerales bacterium]
MPSRLKDRTHLYARIQRWLFAGLVVFAFGFYLLVFYPTHRRAEELQAAVERQRQDLELARERSKDLPRIAAENEALTLRLSQSKRVPRQSEWAEFVRDLTRLGNQESLRKFAYKYGLARHIGEFAQFPVIVSFEGDAMNVYAFLRQIEDLPRLTRLRSILLKSLEESPGQVRAEMALNTYFSTEP